MKVVAQTVGVQEHPERPLANLVAEYLRTATVLLVLDNCEHLLGEAPAWPSGCCGSDRV